MTSQYQKSISSFESLLSFAKIITTRLRLKKPLRYFYLNVNVKDGFIIDMFKAEVEVNLSQTIEEPSNILNQSFAVDWKNKQSRFLGSKRTTVF